MTERLSEEVSDKIEHAADLVHRLILIVGPACAGKTNALRDVAERIGAPLINVNLELAHRLLDLPERQRPRHVQRLLEQVVAETESDVVLLDNIELLFDSALSQDPIRLLRGLSRSRTVAAAWNGSIEADQVCYAAPGHPEYRRNPMDDVLVVDAEAAA